MAVNNPLGLSIKGLKTWNTDDGGGYQFRLYMGATPIADVTQGGYGGPTDARFFGPAGVKALADLEAFVKTQTYEGFDGKPAPMNLDIYLEDLLREHKVAKALERARKGGTVTLFRLPGDGEDVYRTLGNKNQPCPPEKGKVWLEKKHGAGNFTII